jgi:hypothetical protein
VSCFYKRDGQRLQRRLSPLFEFVHGTWWKRDAVAQSERDEWKNENGGSGGERMERFDTVSKRDATFGLELRQARDRRNKPGPEQNRC